MTFLDLFRVWKHFISYGVVKLHYLVRIWKRRLHVKNWLKNWPALAEPILILRAPPHITWHGNLSGRLSLKSNFAPEIPKVECSWLSVSAKKSNYLSCTMEAIFLFVRLHLKRLNLAHASSNSNAIDISYLDCVTSLTANYLNTVIVFTLIKGNLKCCASSWS